MNVEPREEVPVRKGSNSISIGALVHALYQIQVQRLRLKSDIGASERVGTTKIKRMESKLWEKCP